MSLKDNAKKVQMNIINACSKSGRAPNEIRVIAVTKYVDIKQAKEIIDAGYKDIGENRVKEGLKKYQALNSDGIWHFIGNLQSRKVKEIIGKFTYIHSLDRLSLAKDIDKRAKEAGIKVKCFVQVNISGEKTKSGVNPDQILQFIKDLIPYNSIELIGLMTMAPHEEDKELTRIVFRKLRELLTLVNQEQILANPLTELSMGMSNDYEIAIEEGATFIRLGTALMSEEALSN